MAKRASALGIGGARLWAPALAAASLCAGQAQAQNPYDTGASRAEAMPPLYQNQNSDYRTAYPPTPSAPPAANPAYQSPGYRPAQPTATGLLGPNATREQVTQWLAQNAPSSRGKTVFISGPEAFWVEHEDQTAENPMHVVATIHSENFADADTSIRSTYQVTDYDCERQTQYRIYLRRYEGPELTRETRRDTPILKMADFVSPTNPDYAHLRTVCLPLYDQVRKRVYAIDMPAR